MNVLGMGPLELAVIVGLALIVFGPDKLPEIARQVGKAIADIRRVSAEVTGDFQRSLMLEEDPPRPTPPPAPMASPPPVPHRSPRSAADDDVLRPPY